MSTGNYMQGNYGISDGEQRTCPECLITFTPLQPTQKFHDQKCRLKNHHRRRVLGLADEQRSVRLTEEVLKRLDRIEKHLGLPAVAVVVTVHDMAALQAELSSEAA